MLNWFPTPYPDELWYSVLCRFYVSSGIRESTLVKDLLFQGMRSAKMGFLYPSSSMRLVLSQLPPQAFNPRKMILKHTTFLYFARMYKREGKEALLKDILSGQVRKPAHIYAAVPRKGYSLRYCPLCIQEDSQNYGEPYYHVEHQIPLSSVCVRHRCYLIQLDIHNPELALNGRFWPLSQEETCAEAVECKQESELRVNRLIYEYWKMPISAGPTEGHNNLIQTLLNGGYLNIQPKVGPVVNKTKLYEDLYSFHGKESVEKVFGKKIPNDALTRIKHWDQLLPDRYIYIQALLGMPSKQVFDDEPVEDLLLSEIRKLEQQGGFTTLREVARILNRKPYEVKNVFQYYGIDPIWHAVPSGKNTVAKNASLRCNVPAEELKQIRETARILGYRGEGPFALDCVRYVMEQRQGKGQ